MQKQKEGEEKKKRTLTGLNGREQKHKAKPERRGGKAIYPPNQSLNASKYAAEKQKIQKGENPISVREERN